MQFHDLFIQNMKIGRVNSYKNQDMNLNYNNHLENCLKIISYEAFLLSKIRRYINFKTAVTIYKTMILPIIEYGYILYHDCNKKMLKDLQTAQMDREDRDLPWVCVRV